MPLNLHILSSHMARNFLISAQINDYYFHGSFCNANCQLNFSLYFVSPAVPDHIHAHLIGAVSDHSDTSELSGACER